MSSFPRWPRHDQEEIDAVAAVLRSGCTNQWTGPEVDRFEQAIGELVGTDHVLAVSNGTVAMETALRGLDIGPGDDVLVPARSFIASASTPLLVGARPVFADVGRPSGCVTVETLEAARTPDTRCAVVVHLGGWPCDMPAIMNWACEYGILVVEDCAQAHGGRIDGRHVGSFGHAAAFSFCQDKIISTGGEGGCVCLGDAKAWERSWSWRDHGKAHARTIAAPVSAGFQWLVEGPGTNARMTGMQAAIGIVQLGRLESWHACRGRHAAMLRDRLESVEGIDVPWPDSRIDHAWYVLHCHVAADVRDEMLGRLRGEGWPVRSGVCPEIHREPLFADARAVETPVAASLGACTLTLPVHPAATESDMERLADAVIAAAKA